MSFSMNAYINLLMSMTGGRVVIPTTFHDQAKAVEKMVSMDSSGLVDTITDFQVKCASVPIEIETGSSALNYLLNEKWLPNLNFCYRGQSVERGIKGLQKEYYHERWKGASFPTLKMTKYEKIPFQGLDFNLPTGMLFVDGGSIYSEKQSENKYKYYLGKDKTERLDNKPDTILMYKPFDRYFVEYPRPYLIRRGAYKNWLIVDMLKDKELNILDKLIPYFLHIATGDKDIALKLNKIASPEDLEKVKNKYQDMLDDLDFVSSNSKKINKTPMRTSLWSEKVEHVIPSIIEMFKKELFTTSEKGILGSLGFQDIAESVSNSRKESVLSPKPFMREVNSGAEGFQMVMEDVLHIIKANNPGFKNLVRNEWKVKKRPVTDFLSDEFRELIRTIADRGRISNNTGDYIITSGIVDDYEYEMAKIKEEIERGDRVITYPQPIQNSEDKLGIGVEEEHLKKQGIKVKKQSPEGTPESKKAGSPEAVDFNGASLNKNGAPYSSIQSLPTRVKDVLPNGAKRVFLKSFNYAYNVKFKNLIKKESRSFKYAWGVVKQIYKKQNDTWVKIKSSESKKPWNIFKIKRSK